jgi:DNA-binding MarR family transcriptional regulator
MSISPSRFSRTVDNLVRKGYILRQTDPEDRRNNKIELTKAGKNKQGELLNKLEKIEKSILKIQGLDKQSLIENLRLLTKDADIC